MKKLSVIVPIYNAESTLRKCVDSIISQEYSNLEIVLIDDGSIDSSLDVCREYAERDRRVIVFHKDNAGLVAARKSGIGIATGDYIGFVDSDDYIDADMYSSLMSEADKTDADIVVGGIISEYSDHSIRSFNLFPTGFYDETAVKNTIIPGMLMQTGFYKYGIIPGVVTKVFKKHILSDCLASVPDELTLGEDVAITSFAIMDAKSIAITDVAAYHYIQTKTSMIRGYNPKRFEALCKMYNCIERIGESTYQNQTGAYFACVLYGLLSECVNNKNFTKKEAKERMKVLLEDKISERALKSANVSQWTFQDKLKVMLMKNKMTGILYTVFTRSL